MGKSIFEGVNWEAKLKSILLTAKGVGVKLQNKAKKRWVAEWDFESGRRRLT